MIHPKYGHLTYRLSLFSYGDPAPYVKEFEHWQTAYAWAKEEIRTNAANLKRIDIVKQRHDGFIFTGIFRYDVINGRTI